MSDPSSNIPTRQSPSGSESLGIDLWVIVVVVLTIIVGLLLYLEPKAGAAVLGALTALGILVAVVRRRP